MTNHKYTEEYTTILNDNEYRAVDVALNKLAYFAINRNG